MPRIVTPIIAALLALASPPSCAAEQTEAGPAEPSIFSQCSMLKSGFTLCSTYVEAVEKKIERVANLMKPASLRANSRIYKVVVGFGIKADGTLDFARVVTSSRNPALDELVIGAINRAAPFSRFPNAMAKETDGIYIRRTLTFEPGPQ